MTSQTFYKFMEQRFIALLFSAVLIVASIGSLALKGLNFGLDFTGGTLIELSYAETAELNTIRNQLKDEGFDSASVANFGSDREVLIRVQTEDSKLGDALAKQLVEKAPTEVEIKRISYVGPQIGGELRDKGGLGMLAALIVVMVYVALRFQYKFSVGAVAALAHDVIIVLGVFSLFSLDFDLTVLAALLAVIGYSLNDTIVVSDRIRENFRLIRDMLPIEVINTSLTQTLGRTLITSLTTLLVLLALFLVGGELIRNFALALIVGVGIGTYSSIYVSANILLALNITSEDLIVVEKEGEEFEEFPS